MHLQRALEKATGFDTRDLRHMYKIDTAMEYIAQTIPLTEETHEYIKDIKQEIFTWVYKALKRECKTTKAISEKIDKSPSHIYRYLRGSQEVPTGLLRKLDGYVDHRYIAIALGEGSDGGYIWYVKHKEEVQAVPRATKKEVI